VVGFNEIAVLPYGDRHRYRWPRTVCGPFDQETDPDKETDEPESRIPVSLIGILIVIDGRAV
jgi:hypothetical protein